MPRVKVNKPSIDKELRQEVEKARGDRGEFCKVSRAGQWQGQGWTS
jgi:hypothetical protein